MRAWYGRRRWTGDGSGEARTVAGCAEVVQGAARWRWRAPRGSGARDGEGVWSLGAGECEGALRWMAGWAGGVVGAEVGWVGELRVVRGWAAVRWVLCAGEL